MLSVRLPRHLRQLLGARRAPQAPPRGQPREENGAAVRTEAQPAALSLSLMEDRLDKALMVPLGINRRFRWIKEQGQGLARLLD